MSEIQICTFFDLFGFNTLMNPISRLPLKIGSSTYPSGFEFKKENRYQNIEIYKHVNDLALIFHEGTDYINLHMFVPDGTAKKTFLNTQSEHKIYKYGQENHIKDAHENGSFLIAPAIEYMRQEYDSARKDNEVVHKKKVKPESIQITTQDNTSIQPISDIVFSDFHTSIDSYILCFSYAHDKGLYKEFKDSDACLIIHDVDEFSRRIHSEFRRLMPSHLGINNRVSYSSHPSPFGVLFSKPIDYIYQREYRFSWIPEYSEKMSNVNDIINGNWNEIRKKIPEKIKITLGSLQDISSIEFKQ